MLNLLDQYIILPVVMKKNSIIKNFSYLSIGKISGDLLSYILFVYISRIYSIEGAGQYSFAFALTGFFSIFAEFGLHNIVVKELGRSNDNIGSQYSRYFSARLMLTFVSVVVLLLITPFLPLSNETKWIICLIGAYRLIYTLTDGFMSVFIAKGETLIVAFLEVSVRALATLFGVLMIVSGVDIIYTLAILPLVGSLQFILAYQLLSTKYGKPTICFSYKIIIATLKESFPYATSNFLQQITARIDIVLLGFIIGAVAAGIYNAAYRLLFLVIILPYFAGLVLLPVASKLFIDSREGFQYYYAQSLGAIILIGLPIAVGLWLMAENLIILIYGDAFQDSILILRILSASILFLFVSHILGIFLMASDRQIQKARSHWVVAIFNILANIVFIPIFGIHGAAATTVMTEILLVALFLRQMSVVTGMPDLRKKIAIAALGSLLFCLIFSAYPNLPMFIVIPGSILIYGLTLILFRETRNIELLSLIARYTKRNHTG